MWAGEVDRNRDREIGEFCICIILAYKALIFVYRLAWHFNLQNRNMLPNSTSYALATIGKDRGRMKNGLDICLRSEFTAMRWCSVICVIHFCRAELIQSPVYTICVSCASFDGYEAGTMTICICSCGIIFILLQVLWLIMCFSFLSFPSLLLIHSVAICVYWNGHRWVVAGLWQLSVRVLCDEREHKHIYIFKTPRSPRSPCNPGSKQTGSFLDNTDKDTLDTHLSKLRQTRPRSIPTSSSVHRPASSSSGVFHDLK